MFRDVHRGESCSGRTAGTGPNVSDVVTVGATPDLRAHPGEARYEVVLELGAVVESVVDPPEISNACRQCTGLSLVRDGFGLPKKFRATLDRANVLQRFEPFVPAPHSSKRRESTPTDDRAARPKAALEDAAGLMERDRTTASMAVCARPGAPGTTRFEDAQAPVLPSHPMRPR